MFWCRRNAWWARVWTACLINVQSLPSYHGKCIDLRCSKHSAVSRSPLSYSSFLFLICILFNLLLLDPEATSFKTGSAYWKHPGIFASMLCRYCKSSREKDRGDFPFNKGLHEWLAIQILNESNGRSSEQLFCSGKKKKLKDQRPKTTFLFCQLMNFFA